MSLITTATTTGKQKTATTTTMQKKEIQLTVEIDATYVSIRNVRDKSKKINVYHRILFRADDDEDDDVDADDDHNIRAYTRWDNIALSSSLSTLNVHLKLKWNVKLKEEKERTAQQKTADTRNVQLQQSGSTRIAGSSSYSISSNNIIGNQLQSQNDVARHT